MGNTLGRQPQYCPFPSAPRDNIFQDLDMNHPGQKLCQFPELSSMLFLLWRFPSFPCLHPFSQHRVPAQCHTLYSGPIQSHLSFILDLARQSDRKRQDPDDQPESWASLSATVRAQCVPCIYGDRTELERGGTVLAW